MCPVSACVCTVGVLRRGSRGRGAWGAHAPPFYRQNIGKKRERWDKKRNAPNCRKMHLKFQKFLGGMPSDPPGAHTCDERTASLSPTPHAPPPFQNPGSAPGPEGNGRKTINPNNTKKGRWPHSHYRWRSIPILYTHR